MKKSKFGILLCAILFVPITSTAAPGIYRSCDSAGSCNYYNVGGGSIINTPRNVGGGSGGGTILNDNIIDPKRKKAARCLGEKNRIEKENSECVQTVALDGLRETGNCNKFNNSEGGGGVGIQHRLIVLNANYVVQNPTYDKCINQVNAAVKLGDANCGVVYTRNKNTARTANDGECANLYQ